MRRIYFFSLVFVLSICFLLPVNTSRAQTSVTFDVFYSQLSPYGSWVSYNPYGYVWIPTAVSPGFRPYGSAGHWIYTGEGWSWVSDYSWGWAPFHYGNWFYDDTYGWMWVPGYEWAPAWVTWGEYGNEYCWAPIGPSIRIGVSWSSYRPPVHCWTFVPRTYMGRSGMSRYYVHYNTRVSVVNRIRVINNISSGRGRPQYMRGPQAASVERYTHAAVRPVAVTESSRPGRGRVENGRLSVYKPVVNQSPASRPAAPPRVRELHSVKPAGLPGHNRNIHVGRAPAEPAPRANSPASRSPRPVRGREPVPPPPARAGRPAAPEQRANRQEARPSSPRQRPSSAPRRAPSPGPPERHR